MVRKLIDKALDMNVTKYPTLINSLMPMVETSLSNEEILLNGIPLSMNTEDPVYKANDIIFYQTVSNVLSAIGVFSADAQESGGTWLDLSGHYKIGVLEGTVTREYEAHYVGLRARQKYREEKLAELAAEEIGK